MRCLLNIKSGLFTMFSCQVLAQNILRRAWVANKCPQNDATFSVPVSLQPKDFQFSFSQNITRACWSTAGAPASLLFSFLQKFSTGNKLTQFRSFAFIMLHCNNLRLMSKTVICRNPISERFKFAEICKCKSYTKYWQECQQNIQ